MTVFVDPHGDRVELAASVETIDAAFATVLALVARLLRRVDDAAPEEYVPVFAVGASESALLAAFVEDLLVLADSDGLAVTKLERIRVESGTVRAAVGVRPAAEGAAGISVRRAELGPLDVGGWSLSFACTAANVFGSPFLLDRRI